MSSKLGLAISLAGWTIALPGCAGSQQNQVVEERLDPPNSTPTPTECVRPEGTRELAVGDPAREQVDFGAETTPPRILRSAAELEQARAECELEPGVPCYEDGAGGDALPPFDFETNQVLWFPTRNAHEIHVDWVVTDGQTITVGLRREYYCMPAEGDLLMYVPVEADPTSGAVEVQVCERRADCMGNP